MSDLYIHLDKEERTQLRQSMEIVHGNNRDSEAYWNAVSSAYRILGKYPSHSRETSVFYREMLRSILDRPGIRKENTLVQRVVSLFRRK